MLEGAQLEDFQVFGERSSGTNALEWLLTHNTALKPVRDYGWKHGFPVALAYHPSSLIVLVVRDPIDWAISMFNNPHAAHQDVDLSSFSAFIRGEWAMFVRPKINMFWKKPWQMTVRRDVGGQECTFDRDPLTGLRFQNIMKLRYAKLAAMLSIRNRQANFGLVRFEDMMADPAPLLARIRALSGHTQNEAINPLPAHPLNPKARNAKRAMTRAKVSREDHEFLVSQCVLDIETALGYDLSRP